MVDGAHASIINSVFRDNSATWGGAVFAATEATLNMVDSTFVLNTAVRCAT